MFLLFPVTSKKFLCSVIDFKLKLSIFLLSSSIEEFVLVSFQGENEIKKGKTLMEFKYLLFCSKIDLLDIKDFQKKFDR